MLNSIGYECLQIRGTYSSGQVCNHPSCSDYGTFSFSVHCEEQLWYKAEVCWLQMLFLEVHILALWNILAVLQLLVMTTIPACVLLLTHPQVTIILLLIPVGFTLVVAYMLYQCQKPRSRNFQSSAKCCGSTCSHSVVITATIGLILSLLVLYELMLLVQVQIETGVKGIVLSLLPSFPLSALGR